MTGFSSVDGPFRGDNLRVEIKGVNHRFQDLKIRIPRELLSVEPLARRHLSAVLGRGSIEVRIEKPPTETQTGHELELNLSLAQSYFEKISKLADQLKIAHGVDAKGLCDIPNILSTKEDSPEKGTPDELWAELKPLADTAVLQFLDARQSEGAKLVDAISDAKSDLEDLAQTARTQRKKVQAGYPERIQEKIKRLFDQYPVQDAPVQTVLESRIAQELALLLDRTDIEEELTRLDGHLKALDGLLQTPSPIGRKLEFMLQEVHREITTLGNKAQDFKMGETVVDMKVLNEQMREQVLNLE